jgi:aryl-alcohol dehydrogenase-like predicted oxidoreductase
MEYRKLGRTGLEVSELALGTMQFGWTTDEESAWAVMDAFREAGGNLIDTADVYSRWAEGNPGGVAEEVIGRWMKGRGNRQEIGRAHAKGVLQVALAWLLTNPLVTAPIVGANSVEQLGASLEAVGLRLSAEEMEALNELSDWREE